MVDFYETFLQAYDPKLREVRGVYYTPEPVVQYLVQSVDWLLRDRFGLKDGLAGRSKIPLPAREGGGSGTGESHRVLILDPAAGTATFLYAVLDHIRARFKRQGNAGQWASYVHEHLLTRLYGFELLMAPYAVAHFKLGLALAAKDEEPLFRPQWSYEPRPGERLNIYLTNTLEEAERRVEMLGPLRALSNEANAAADLKAHRPVLVVRGNPPYSGHSANQGAWIGRLVREYYFCDGRPLGERNPKWLQDDYVKFIRWGQWRIEQTGQGILGFITNHGYLDNPTFRGMRQHLLRSFDEIYLLDLHGNAKKRETVPDTGEPDKNVFDIQQGVAIGIFVKWPPERRARKKGRPEAGVHHADLWGAQRQVKYDWLARHHIRNTRWTVFDPGPPHYRFIPPSTRRRREYERGWKITEMMPVHSLGITAGRDHFTKAFTPDELRRRLVRFVMLAPEAAREEFLLGPDSGDWKAGWARQDVRFVPEGHGRPARREVGPEAVQAYAYAVFHSPSWYQRYHEFLRADFPRLPLTRNLTLFRTLAELGSRLLDLHTRGEGRSRGPSFPIKGSDRVEEVRCQPPRRGAAGRVWINATQYVDGLPGEAWTFPIGGYLPAQRWLKDRRGRPLSHEDLATYQHLVWALTETPRLMGEIDACLDAHGGWPLEG